MTGQLLVDNLVVGPVSAPRLSLSAGQCALIRGPSGSGKTLFLRALADLIPHAGRVSLDGEDAGGMDADQWRRHVMLVPADTHWWSHRVADHFPAPLEAATLSLLGLPSDAGERDPAQMSSGERQRLALLRAMARSPRVLLLDEPGSHLDDDSNRLMETALLDWITEGNMAVVVSHDADQRARLAGIDWRLANGILEAQP
jgi:putative ABC transport system ATP-binding protein